MDTIKLGPNAAKVAAERADELGVTVDELIELLVRAATPDQFGTVAEIVEREAAKQRINRGAAHWVALRLYASLPEPDFVVDECGFPEEMLGRPALASVR